MNDPANILQSQHAANLKAEEFNLPRHTHAPCFGRKVEGCVRCHNLSSGVVRPVRWSNRNGYGR